MKDQLGSDACGRALMSAERLTWWFEVKSQSRDWRSGRSGSARLAMVMSADA